MHRELSLPVSATSASQPKRQLDGNHDTPGREQRHDHPWEKLARDVLNFDKSAGLLI
jgi:hypothetical protein